MKIRVSVVIYCLLCDSFLRTTGTVEQTVSGFDGLVDLIRAGVIIHFPEAEAHNGHIVSTVKFNCGSCHFECFRMLVLKNEEQTRVILEKREQEEETKKKKLRRRECERQICPPWTPPPHRKDKMQAAARPSGP